MHQNDFIGHLWPYYCELNQFEPNLYNTWLIRANFVPFKNLRIRAPSFAAQIINYWKNELHHLADIAPLEIKIILIATICTALSYGTVPKNVECNLNPFLLHITNVSSALWGYHHGMESICERAGILTFKHRVNYEIFKFASRINIESPGVNPFQHLVNSRSILYLAA